MKLHTVDADLFILLQNVYGLTSLGHMVTNGSITDVSILLPSKLPQKATLYEVIMDSKVKFSFVW